MNDSSKRKRGRPLKEKTASSEKPEVCSEIEKKKPGHSRKSSLDVIPPPGLDKENIPPPGCIISTPHKIIRFQASTTPTPRKVLVRTSPASKSFQEIVGPCQSSFNTSKLPTNRAILQRYREIRLQNVQRPKKDIAEAIVREVVSIWQSATIPTQMEHHCVEKVLKVINGYCMAGTNTQSTLSKPVYQNFLDSLCDISPIDVEQQLASTRSNTWREDYAFFQGQQKVPQVGTISSSIDMKAVRKEKNKEERQDKIQQQKLMYEKRKHEENLVQNEANKLMEEIDDQVNAEKDTESETDDPTWFPATKKMKKHDSIMLDLPTKNIGEITATLASRLRLSINSELSIFARVILAGSGNLSDFVLSRTTLWRQRIEAEKKAVDKIKSDFNVKNPEFIVLHWDSKQVKFESGKTQEHLAICAQMPVEESNQFLGAPRIPNGTGMAQADALIRTCDKWGIENKVVFTSWDTTAANSGHNKGSAVLFQQALGRACPSLPCRHHAAERHVHHANRVVRGNVGGMYIISIIKPSVKIQIIPFYVNAIVQ